MFRFIALLFALFPQLLSAQSDLGLFEGLPDSLSKQHRTILNKKNEIYLNETDKIEQIKILNSITDTISDPEITNILNQKILTRIKSVISKTSVKDKDEITNIFKDVLIKTGNYYVEHGLYEQGLPYFFKAEQICQKLSDTASRISIFIDISRVFHGQGDFDEALKYVNKAREFNDMTQDTLEKCYILNNLGVIHGEKEEYEKSITSLNECFSLSTAIKNSHLQGMALNNLGGYHASLGNIDTAMYLLKRACSIFEKSSDPLWTAYSYAKLGSVQLKENNHSKGISNSLLALQVAEAKDFEDIKRRCYKSLYKAYEEQGDQVKAFAFHKKFVASLNKLRSNKTKTETLKIQMRYELEKQQELNKVESEKQLAISNGEKNRQSIINYSLTSGAFLLFIFSIIIARRLKISNQQKHKIEQQNNDRKLLLKEIHHRVKNNFQVISSLLRLQAADEGSEHVEQVFDDAVSRIQSMASVHELIYKNEMFSELNIKDYLDKLVSATRSYSLDDRISISIDTEVERLNIKTLIPIGIAINELVTNSLKYAFDGTLEDPQIHLELFKSEQNNLTLMYKDNGTGFEPTKSSGSFGLELIHTVLEQINGVMKQSSEKNWKNTVQINFQELH